MTNDASKGRLLITGATGKVGRNFLERFLDEPRFSGFRVRAICHKRTLAAHDRVEIVRGSISDRAIVDEALVGVTHILHLATCKETPQDIMDVAVKGMFWLLEAARASDVFRQFILVGGDAGVGHFFYPHPVPVTEIQGHSAYPGCYALSKVLEEVMLEQYSIQYELNGCCLRAPWIMEKDDFKYTLSFGKDVFGGPRWCDLVPPEDAAVFAKKGTIPVLCDEADVPIDRNFVHVSDLVEAILLAIDHPRAAHETFNICMDEPVNYRRVGEHLSETHGLPSVDISTEYVSTWLDNSKARFLLRWRPRYDLARLIDDAWSYQRAENDPRKIWYPG